MQSTKLDQSKQAEQWALALACAANGFELTPSLEQIRLHLQSGPERLTLRELVAAADTAGLKATVVAGAKLSPVAAPCLVELADGQVVVVARCNEDTAHVVIPSANSAFERQIERSWFNDHGIKSVLAVAPRGTVRDRRIDTFLLPYRRSWFRSLLIQHLGSALELMGGAFFGNILALATALFSMQLWDRVIPAQSLPTLWVLTLGVAIALLVELSIKLLRTTISDGFSKELDLKMSSMFFLRALDLRNDRRPRSPGTLIAQLRELDQIREMMTSTTLTVLFEIPFVVTFMFVIWLIGGPLVYVLLAIIPLVLLLCAIIQWPLARLARMGLRESALRNAMLVESIERIEDIKSLQAEARFGALWDRLNAENAKLAKKSRFLTAFITNVTMSLQQLAYVAVLVAGVYLVLDNTMTTGALMACSMLTSRAIAPLAQIAGIFARLQAARTAREGLDKLLQVPLDHGSRDRLHRPVLKPDIVLERVNHVYDKSQRPALVVPRVAINAGERVALIGRIGSGKSTLLKLCAGLMPPSEGRVLLDGTDLASIDMADIRRDIGSYHQDANLFVGTVRSNLKLGAPLASDEDLLAALSIIGPSAQLFVEGQGLDMAVEESGRGLSSGQRQALLLARTLLRSPRALLLDEPTGSMDENTERAFVSNLRQWLGARTLVVATHRYALLEAVDRVIVVEQGRIVLDGPRDEMLQILSGSGSQLQVATPVRAASRPVVNHGAAHVA